MRRGDRVLLRLVGAGQFTRPMHLHGPDFRIVAKDGHPVSDPQAADVVQVASGERYDIAFTATEPGPSRDEQRGDPGGLLVIVDVGGKGAPAPVPTETDKKPGTMEGTEGMAGHGESAPSRLRHEARVGSRA